MCDTRNIYHTVNTGCTDVYRGLNTDFCSFLPEVQTRLIENIDSMIRHVIYSTGTKPATAQPHNDQGSFDEDVIDYIPQ